LVVVELVPLMELEVMVRTLYSLGKLLLVEEAEEVLLV
jgi:hypothetical protein